MYKKLIRSVVVLILLSTQLYSGETQPMIGKYAPDFSLVDLNGNTITLSELKGNFIVLHFATSWCPYCNAEAPSLEALYNDYKNQNVIVLIIDVRETIETAQPWAMGRHNFSFPVLLDSDGQVSAQYAPKDVLPDLPRDEVPIASNLIIDKEGKIQFYSLLDSKNFDAQLTELTANLTQLMGE